VIRRKTRPGRIARRALLLSGLALCSCSGARPGPRVLGAAGALFLLERWAAHVDLSALLWPERAPAQITLADVFQTPVFYPLDRVATSLRLADLDGDGHTDVIFLADPNNTALGVFHNAGPEGFDPARYTELERGWLSVTAGDLNGDGAADLVLLDRSWDVVTLLNRGDGTFEDPSYQMSGQYPNVALLADLDLDGDLDFAVVFFSSDPLMVRMNNGRGDFYTDSWAGDHYAALTEFSFHGAVGDLDGDGFPDLLVVGKQVAPGSFFHNRGDGTFAPAVAFASDVPRIFDVVPADLNGDGDIDLVAGSFDGIFVLYNEGAGQLAPAVSVASFASLSLLAVDFTGDGAPDLVTDFGLLVNNGDGTFGPLMDFGVSFLPNSVVAGDVNSDGRPDLVGIANGGVTVLRGR
jgi:hypothetical protein